jgi:hypothetical protein
MKKYNDLKWTDIRDIFSILFHDLEMAATKRNKTKQKKKDAVMRPRCVVDCNCAMGGKYLRSKTRVTPH